MDDEGSYILWFLTNLAHLQYKVHHRLNELFGELRNKITDVKIKRHNATRSEKSTLEIPLHEDIKKFKETKELVNALGELRDFLIQEANLVEESKSNAAIERINKWIIHLEQQHELDFVYTDLWVFSALDDEWLAVTERLRTLVLNVKERVDEKITHMHNDFEFKAPSLRTDITTIQEKTDFLAKNLRNNIAKKFLLSAAATFTYAGHNLNSAFEAQWGIIAKEQEAQREKAQSSLTSAIILLVSAYEKTLCACAYELGAETKEQELWYQTSLNEIKNRSIKAHEIIRRTDREFIIQGIRNLRHAETHRFAEYDTLELQGHVQTMTKEIRRALEALEFILGDRQAPTSQGP